jgi:hypothetical protein
MLPRTTHRYSVRVAAALCALALTLGVALAEDAPQQGKPTQADRTASEAIQGPQLPAGVDLAGRSAAELSQFLQFASGEIDDKGSSFTDAGAGRVNAGPNALERAKLDMARAAVEASRAAGTLFVSAAGPTLPERPADIEAIKLQQLLSTPSQVDGIDVPAGLDPSLEPLQQMGPDALNAVEQAKLAGEEPVVEAADRVDTAGEQPKTRSEAEGQDSGINEKGGR